MGPISSSWRQGWGYKVAAISIGLGTLDWKQEASIRERLLFGLILVMVLFGFFRFFWSPKRSQIHQGRQQLATLKMQIETLQKLMETEAKRTQGLAPAPGKEGEPAEARWLAYATGKPDILVEELTQYLMPQSLGGMELVKLGFPERQFREGFTVVPMEVDLKGKFASFVSWLKKIETLPRLVEVGTIRLEAPEGGGPLNLHITLSLYVVS